MQNLVVKWILHVFRKATVQAVSMCWEMCTMACRVRAWISSITGKKKIKKAETKILWYVLWWAASWDTNDKMTFCTLVVKSRKFYQYFYPTHLQILNIRYNKLCYLCYVNHVFHFTSQSFFTQSLGQIFVNSE